MVGANFHLFFRKPRSLIPPSGAQLDPALVGSAISATAQGSATPAWRPLIDLRNVVKSYRTEAGEYVALKGVSFQVGRGEFVAVIGKSGSGKSTLSNMITGIDRPTSGEVIVDDMAVHKLSEGEIAVWRGKTVGVVFQFFQLLPTLTVLENIMLPMDFCNTFRGERKDRAMALLERVEMAHQSQKLPTALSGGQQQRVAIARALANDPAIIVADEPTGNLDSRTADSVFHLFEQLVAGGKTILMVTHDDDLARRATRTVTIADGTILSDRLNLTPHGVEEEEGVEAEYADEPPGAYAQPYTSGLAAESKDALVAEASTPDTPAESLKAAQP